jgi:protein-tyrosine phosphatase
MTVTYEALGAYADLHCHILPAWDDGAKTLEISLAMARRAVDSGLEQVAVTPHVGRVFAYRDEPDDANIARATEELQKVLHEYQIPLQLVAGAEILLDDPAVIERIISKPHLTLGGRGKYCLVEAPGRTWPPHAERLIVELARNGITAIIAHPERLADVQRADDVWTSPLRGVLAQGTLLQVTARCLKPRDDAAQSRCSRRLLEAGVVSLIASDAHTESAVLPGEVASELQSIVGEEAAHAILQENPRRVLAGEFAQPPRVEISQSKRGSLEKLRALFSSSR